MHTEWAGEQLVLLPERAIWWPARRALLVADVHLGKSGHFRKHGLAIPAQIEEKDLLCLQSLWQRLPVEELLILGDLFHSGYNRQWERFGEVRAAFGGTVRLIRGNHDMLRPAHYNGLAIEVVDQWAAGPFLMTHEPMAVETIPADKVNLAGHLHPGILLRGKGRQRLRLPCYWLGPRQGLLPAFGRFTGLANIQPAPEDLVFAIAEDRVLYLKSTA